MVQHHMDTWVWTHCRMRIHRQDRQNYDQTHELQRDEMKGGASLTGYSCSKYRHLHIY